MNNLKTKSFGIAVVVASAALAGMAGCELYFGDSSSSSGWSYCGSDGEYQCDGNDNCTLVSSTCTSQTGESCGSNADCAAGCYCSGGTCTEGGFCGSNADCGSGYTCDPTRSSCEPVGSGSSGCGSNADCGSGGVCDTTTGACSACTCSTDQQAIDQGYGWCDNGVCETGTDPNGACTGAITCNDKPPVCAEHEVPLILNGCYTGVCGQIGACTAAPACSERQHADDCAADPNCNAVSTGIDCTTPNGAACQAGDANCTCASFEFSSCEDKGSGS
jgi:Cys-rich repeat protein